jgi:hypothetical protein
MLDSRKKPVVEVFKAYPLARTIGALEAVRQRRVTGKAVLVTDAA